MGYKQSTVYRERSITDVKQFSPSAEETLIVTADCADLSGSKTG